MTALHPHGRGGRWLLGLVLFLGACMAGQYDIEDCDPSVPNLQMDLCNRLNESMGVSGCMKYQCDNVTHRCVMKAVDYDRDGDPSRACGGADCDDSDPAVYGTAVELCDNKDNNCNTVKDEGCACDPKVIGTTCYDGKGACKRSGQFICNANVPICTAKGVDPQSAWHNATDLVNRSADWNCNGMDEFTCCADGNCAQPFACPVFECPSNDPNALCLQFCNAQNVLTCLGATATGRCDSSCGGRTLICRCTIAFAAPPCQPSGSSFGVVGCQ